MLEHRAGECVATISIVLPEHKVVESRDRYAEAVRGASERIEQALGSRDPSGARGAVFDPLFASGYMRAGI